MDSVTTCHIEAFTLLSFIKLAMYSKNYFLDIEKAAVFYFIKNTCILNFFSKPDRHFGYSIFESVSQVVTAVFAHDMHLW